MKKRLLVLWCLSILLLISACSNDGVMPLQSDSDPSGISDLTESSSPSPQQTLLEEAQGPVPDFLDAAQQSLYKRAKTAYMEFTLYNGGFGSEGSGESELEQDGMQYYKCNGTMTKWTDFEDAMLSVFTPEYFEELNHGASYTDGDGVLHERTIFMEHIGDLYYSGGARGGDITFVEPETFELESQSDDEIRFYVVGTYDDFAYDQDGNLIEDEGGDYRRAGDPTQEKRLLIMQKSSNGWRFAEFQLAY